MAPSILDSKENSDRPYSMITTASQRRSHFITVMACQLVSVNMNARRQPRDF